MSETLDFVRSIYVDWERGDYSSVEWAHPEIEWEYAADGPAPRGGTGLAGMAADRRDLVSTVDEAHHKADRYTELDGDRVLVFHHIRGRAKASGMDLDQLSQGAAVLFHIRNGRVTRM